MGYQGFTYGPGAGSGWVNPDASPTATKPQSKLWFAQDRWWGVLIDPASNDFHIHSLDPTTQRWTTTGVVVDTRNGSRADALWDGSKLFIASHLGSGSSASSAVRITRYSFAGGTYVRDSGFPVTVSSGGVEAAVIAKDTTGRLWVTFTQSNKVRVAVSQPGGQSWGAPFSPAVAGVNVTSDDISTLTTYDGQVSVVWSNQVDDSVYAATRSDGDPVTTWQVARRVIAGPNEADDHINLASVEGDSSGRLFVAVKTGQDDISNNANAPLIRLLVLGTDDVWRQHIHSRVRDGLTRPIVLLDTTNRVLRVFAAGPNTGGVIYMKETPLGSISFGDGKGQPFIALASDKNINNPTSTKQNLSAATGLVVLAADQVTGRYAHNTMSLGSAPPPPPPPAPAAAFSATPTSGQAPLAVSFSDQSTGTPDSWSWSFGDGGSASTRNPSHTYTAPGTYDVSLTVSNANGSDTETRTGLITVGSPPAPAAPVAAFSATPTSGQAPLAVSFSDQSTGTPDSWSWSFGDGGSATTRNPSHTYTAPGTYDVSLTVSNANGSDAETRAGLITVGPDSPPPPGGYQAAVTADNPVGYWRLGGSGTTAEAVVGSNGTVNGGVTATAGALSGDTDGARSFNGSTGYISVPSSPALNATGDFSVEAWVRPSVAHSGVVVQKGGANGYSVWQYRLGMTSGGQWRGTVFVGTQAFAVTAPGQAALNTWTHLVLTRTAGTLRIYVDGSLVSSAAAAGVLNSTGSMFAIGRSGASATSYFNGGIDEVAFYGQAVSAASVAAHYAAGRG